MTDTANANDIIMKGLSNETEGLGRFGHHPNPAIDFCIEVETLESRLHQAEHGLSKPRSVPETIAAVLHDIQKALNFRVGGDEGAVSAKHLLRSLEDKAKSLILTDTANAPERIWMTAEDHGASWPGAFRAFRCSDLDHSNDDGPNPDYPEYVLATHCDELVAAAYLDAAGVAYGRSWDNAVKLIKARTPDNARAALTARDERMKAEGAREAQVEIKRLTEALKEIAGQKKTSELDTEYDVECADFEAGYDACIDRARAALQENADE